MNRFQDCLEICIEIIQTSDEACQELHDRGWTIGHAVYGDIHQVSGHKDKLSIVANAQTALDAWLLACAKANEQERLHRHRN